MKLTTFKLWAASLCLIFASQLGANTLEFPTCTEDCDPVEQICLNGFQITFLERTVNLDKKTTTFKYKICDKHKTACKIDPKTCQSRQLDHIDIVFPKLGKDCLKDCTKVAGDCSKGDFSLGDSDCFKHSKSSKFVAKCDNLKLRKGDCFIMTIKFNEEVKLGSTQVVLSNKDSIHCHASCIAGPSCTDECEPPPPNGDDKPCLTRTIGFWSNHPWITNDFSPVTVCGVPLGCNDPATTTSNPGCGAGECTDVMEGLASNPSELDGLNQYISMVRQLTAAKLNLAATAEVLSGSCETYRTEDGQTIQQKIAECEALCNASSTDIGNSGCIDALDAFNNSVDTGFVVVPPPFAQPGIDDFGNNSGADNTGAQEANGNDIVVNKGICALP